MAKIDDYDCFRVITQPLSIVFLIAYLRNVVFSQAPSCVAGRGTGLTSGQMDVWSSTMTNSDVTWRMRSTWRWTASTSATPMRVKVSEIYTSSNVFHLAFRLWEMRNRDTLQCLICLIWRSRWWTLHLFKRKSKLQSVRRSSLFIAELTPPDGKSKDSLLQIVCRDGRIISLCADSADDALWVIQNFIAIVSMINRFTVAQNHCLSIISQGLDHCSTGC